MPYCPVNVIKFEVHPLTQFPLGHGLHHWSRALSFFISYRKFSDMLNENETLYSSTKVYEYMYGNSTLYVTYYFGLALVIILGPLLSLPIVFYERFGADRQKRTIINRLLSLIFINITMQSCIWSVFRLVRGTVGLLEDDSILLITMFSQVLIQ